MKRILSFSIAGLLVAVFIATIVTALVKSTFYYPIANENVVNVEVWKNGAKYKNTYLSAYEEDKEVIDEILRLNEKGFKETVLASIFLNHYSFKTDVVYQSVNVNNIIENPLNEYVLVLDFSGYYSENTKKLELFGKEYKDDNISTGDASVYYQKMIFKVSNTSTMQEVTIYLENTSNTAPELNNSLYQITTLAKQSELYKYLKHITSQ